jgi:nondiscriminating aspartyl-tRNA synthetase
MERTKINELKGKIGETVLVKGWVQEFRGQSKIKFMLLRDNSGVVQCVLFDTALFDTFSKITTESVVSIEGLIKTANVKSAEVTEKTIEIEVKKLDIINTADPLPISVVEKDKSIVTDLSKRLDYRFLDLHKRDIQAIFKIQSTLLQAYHEFMIKEGAIEALFPSIIGASSEGGTEVYPVKYFEKSALLSQSCQLYKQMLACSMEKVFAVFTVWRAEKHNTVRHLNESRQFDFEMAFADDKAVMDVLARCVQFMVARIIKENQAELDMLKATIKVPGVKYITFAETAELMEKHNIEMGEDDLSGEAEEKLGELFPETIVFVHDWPISGKPFYIMPKGEDLSYGFDAIYRGMEISSGGQRIHLPELLSERLKVKDLNPENFKSYIDSFRYGAPPHAGWGAGVERLTMLICGLKNIREAVLFPRDRDRLTP